MKNYAIFMLIAFMAQVAPADTGASATLIQKLATCDVVGSGVVISNEANRTRIGNINYWAGDLGTNSITLTSKIESGAPVLPHSAKTGDTIVFFGIHAGWNHSLEDLPFDHNVSAWRIRQFLANKGVRSPASTNPATLEGDSVAVPDSSTTFLLCLSNIVDRLCVNTNLSEFSKSLLPALEVEADDELFSLKASSHLELLKLMWDQNEGFLISVLNDTQYSDKFRGHALFQLQKRFDWPANSALPTPPE